MTTTKKVAGRKTRAPATGGLTILESKLNSMFQPRTGQRIAKPAPAEPPAPPVEAAPPKPVKRRRRRRRASAQVVAARTMADIKRKEREFLREVSAMLTDALGFPVRVSHVKVAPPPMTPRMNKFARMPKREAHRQVMEAFAPLNDSVADL